jgi:hypothetical protein
MYFQKMFKKLKAKYLSETYFFKDIKWHIFM